MADNASKRSRESDDEDLDGFIVKDTLYKELTRKKKKNDEDTEIVEGGEAETSDEEEAESVQDLPDDGAELAKVLEEEASKLTKDIKTVEVGGRSLRDRSQIQKPKDTYWEKQGAKDYEKLLEKDHKKDILDDLKSIKKDQERNKEEYPELPAEFKWPVVSARDSLETVEAAQNYVCEALQIEFDDDDESEDESDDQSEDSEDHSEDVSEDETSDSETDEDESEDSEDDEE